MEKAKLKNIYCDDELDNLIKENFTKGKWGYQKFSKVTSKLLKDYLKNKPTLEKIEQMEQNLINNIEKSKRDLQDIQMQKELLLEERDIKFILSDKEASFLNETYRIINMDEEKLEPRLRIFNNIFKKNVNKDEFLELIEKAKEEFPNSPEFVIEI
jgi:hypothetical protein